MTLLRHWFAHPLLLSLLAVLPVLGLIAFLALRRRRRQLLKLAFLPSLHALALVRPGLRKLRAICLVVGLAFLAIGIAGPQWGREQGQTTVMGRDLVVVLDMSWSMHAHDVLPSRLGRAREALLDLVDVVQKRGGHRLGLIVFASRPHVLCPLTPDHDHFRYIVETLDLDTPPPELWPITETDSVSGTRIGEGLKAGLKAHDSRFQGFQAILLISDGDDPARDNEWRKQALAVRNADVPVFTVGVGDPDTPSKIVIKGNPLESNGRDVLTKLEEAPLEEIAQLTNGKYIAARTSALPLGQLFRDHIEPGPLREASDDALLVYRPRYVWFYLPALGLLIAALAINDYPRPRKTPLRKEPNLL